jgi:hypothetical protein
MKIAGYTIRSVTALVFTALTGLAMVCAAMPQRMAAQVSSYGDKTEGENTGTDLPSI